MLFLAPENQWGQEKSSANEWVQVYNNNSACLEQIHSQGVWHATPNLPIGACLAMFSQKNWPKWGFCRKFKGVRFKKSTFWVQKVNIVGVQHLSIFDPGCGSGYVGIESLACHFLHTHILIMNVVMICRACVPASFTQNCGSYFWKR